MTDFESENLTLDGETEIDAFNDDTFGDANVEWDEDEHAKQLEQMGLNMRLDGGRGDFEPRTQGPRGANDGGTFNDADDFFDLNKGSELIGDSLEPEGLETAAETVFLEEDEVDYEGISDLESREVAELFNSNKTNGNHHRQVPEVTEQFSRQKIDDQPVDQAILNVIRQPVQMPPQMPPHGWLPPGLPQLPPGVPVLAQGMRPMMPFPIPPMHPGMMPPPAHMMPNFPPRMMAKQEFEDPAIMAMGNHRLSSQVPPPGPARPQGPPAGAKSLQDLERELMSQHQHRDHHRDRHQRDQRDHRGYDQRNHRNQRNNNFRGNRKNFDDKNKETFGEDFVADHQQRQQRPAQRYHYGERDTRQLITPGHVHVLGILRDKVKEEGKTQPTGNPMLDMVREREQDLRHGQVPSSYMENIDEYSGLMTQRERQWIINIQLNQLKCENPFLDDYYFTVFNQKREQEEKDALELAEKRKLEMSKQHRELHRQLSLSEEAKDSSRQLRRDEEGAQLLLPAETSGVDANDSSYTPKQFTNSLGKLQASSVKAPRKMLDVGIMLNEPEGNSAQKEIRNYKLTLLELERMYTLLIDVEDCEKKLMALPTNTAMRHQVEQEKEEAIKRLCPNLAVESRLKKYLVVRKGKVLMVRALRLLNELQMKIFCSTLFSIFASAVKRDRDDHLLKLLWNAGIKNHLETSDDIETLCSYLQLLKNLIPSATRAGSKSPPPSKGGSLKVVLSTPLGVSIVGLCLQKVIKLSTSPGQKQETDRLINEIGLELSSEVKEVSRPADDDKFEIELAEDQVKNFKTLLSALNRSMF